MTRGEQLKKAREAKGKTLDEVYAATRIQPYLIRALEEDRPTDLAPIYEESMLRSYCAFLGIDLKEPSREKELFQEKEKEERRPQKESVKFTPRSFVKRGIPLTKLVFLIILFVFAIFAFKIGKSISLWRATSAEKKKSSFVSQEGQSVAEVKGIFPKLCIRAKENCWLKVKLDGNTVFRGTLKRGSTETWQARKKIEFSLGNAGGVKVEVNGRLIRSLGKRGQVIKNIVVTKEGLSAPK
ncbi:MAG: DUF4115 domain-containing protein [Candidatus Omnitrophica bacterium]|nr:DUF4115 domain-containing protein [Candidatus Omnitrophota bacterium]